MKTLNGMVALMMIAGTFLVTDAAFARCGGGRGGGHARMAAPCARGGARVRVAVRVGPRRARVRVVARGGFASPCGAPCGPGMMGPGMMGPGPMPGPRPMGGVNVAVNVGAMRGPCMF